MIVHIPKVLAPEQVARCRDVMVKAEWVDGRVTAGHQSQRVKNNLQLPEDSAQARELGQMVMQALGPQRAVLLGRVAEAGVSAAIQPL